MKNNPKDSSKNQSRKEKLAILRHSAAHLLAQAVKELFPNTKLTLGPATKTGFFYDMLPEVNFKESDLPKIEERMRELAHKDYKFEHKEISKEQAKELYKDNVFKLELIDSIPGDVVGLAVQGDFYDLCRGGHVDSTGQLKNFKLLGISGSYWRADKSNQALQRIHGTAFFTEEELKEFEQQQEELLKFDHRKIGKELDLFSFQPEGPGFPFFHPKGQVVINKLKDYLRHLQSKLDYQEVATPTMLNDELWRQSGHYAHYKDNMYFSEIDDKSFAIKPMNCPGMFLIYNNRPRSYRELPFRMFEFGHVHRHELSGVLHGLLRVRAFTIDDGHIFCTQDQLEDEIKTLIGLTFKVLKKFGFENIKVAVSTKPENSIGGDDKWELATNALEEALSKSGIKYIIQEGEGAFYGPKIEFVITDSMGREWQCSTIQVDFFQPENFDMTYVSPEGKLERPVIIHRAIYGSLERFFAVLLEHNKGRLPYWLAPLQVKILTITDDQKEYAEKIHQELLKNNIRVGLDESSDPLSGKIKTAQLDQVPWMIVIGKKEVANNTVTLRHLDGRQENNISINDFVERAIKENSY